MLWCDAIFDDHLKIKILRFAMRTSFEWWMEPLEMVFRQPRWGVVGDYLRKLKCFSWINADLWHNFWCSFTTFGFLWFFKRTPYTMTLNFYPHKSLRLAGPTSDSIFTCRGKVTAIGLQRVAHFAVLLIALLDCREQEYFMGSTLSCGFNVLQWITNGVV